jgi:hypothetical protein
LGNYRLGFVWFVFRFLVKTGRIKVVAKAQIKFVFGKEVANKNKLKID